MDKRKIKKECFVALFDILGFGQIVKNEPISKVISKLALMKKSIKKEVIAVINNLTYKQEMKLGFHFFADTFLLFTSDISDDNELAGDALFQMIIASNSLFNAANEYNFRIRGAITLGELYFSQQIQAGKVIICAHDLEKKQDWIGCLIDTKCITKTQNNRHIKELLKDKTIIEYDVPLKPVEPGLPGLSEKKYVLNWVRGIFIRTHFENDRTNCASFNKDKVVKGIFFLQPYPYEIDECGQGKIKETRKFVDYALTPDNLKAYMNSRILEKQTLKGLDVEK